jgi:hypothetical protein
MALIAMERHVTIFSYFKPRPRSPQTTRPTKPSKTLRADSVTRRLVKGRRRRTMGWGSFRVAKGGDRISAKSLNYIPGLLSPKKLGES